MIMYKNEQGRLNMTYERVELPVGALCDIETYAQAARMDPADMAGDLFRSGLTLFDELAQAKGWAHARATFNALCQPDQPKQMAACYTTLDTRKMLRRISDEIGMPTQTLASSAILYALHDWQRPLQP